jgi:hypothetical protein
MGRVLLALVSMLFLVTQVMAGGWTSNNFLYKPAIGARGADEKAKFDSGLNRVDSRLANEKWLNDSLYNGDLNTAITAIGSAQTALSLPAGNWSVTANLTVPANLTLKFAHGALLSIATGKTLTINGSVEAQPYQIFACTGTGKVVFGSQKVVAPEWWGAVINASGTDCGPPIQQAITALTYGASKTVIKGGVIEFQRGTYFIGTQVNLANDVEFRGFGGMAGAGTIFQRSANVIMFQGTGVSTLDPAFDENMIWRVTFNGIRFYDNDAYASDMINLKACMNFKFANCEFFGIAGRAIYTWELQDSRFIDCYFSWCGKVAGSVPVMEMVSSDTTFGTTNNIYFYGCVFEASRYTAIKTTGTSSDHYTVGLYFVNTKFDNTDLAGPTLDFTNAQQVKFTNTLVGVQRNKAIDELVKFTICNHVDGDLWLIITNTGAEAIQRVMTIDTNAGVNECHMNLFLTGTNWDLIAEDAAVNLDNVAQAAKIHVRTYGPLPGNAGYNCTTKSLTNFPRQNQSFYGSAIDLYAPAGTAGDWMATFTHALTAGGTDKWVQQVAESGGSTYMEWVLNTTAMFRIVPSIVQVVATDLQIATNAKGVIMTNAAGTVTKRVRLNDAGDGLIFENP